MTRLPLPPTPHPPAPGTAILVHSSLYPVHEEPCPKTHPKPVLPADDMILIDLLTEDPTPYQAPALPPPPLVATWPAAVADSPGSRTLSPDSSGVCSGREEWGETNSPVAARLRNHR